MRLMKVTSLSQLDPSKEYLAYIKYEQGEDQASYIGLAHLYASGQAWNAYMAMNNTIWDTPIDSTDTTIQQFCIELD